MAMVHANAPGLAAELGLDYPLVLAAIYTTTRRIQMADSQPAGASA
jgi:hypothetical protein